ncbi:MAG: type III pantothenate kinase [Muribaculaceae bacterium]|nr:type III pantothenate kinase [Muribaculaceae bacterium]
MRRDYSRLPVLTIDQGNSSSKAVVWQGEEALEAIRLEALGIEGLLPVMEGRDFDGCAFCSVAHNDAKFLETLRRMLDGRLVVMTPSLPLPIKVTYGSRATLGADRVAAAAGAASLFPSESLLVVDAGTAMTLDFVSGKAEFLGGNISPGMKMRFDSLHEATSRLPQISAEGPLPEYGEDTETAIRCGVIHGLASEITGTFSKARALCGASRVVLTGSDASVLLPMLEREGIPTVVEPNLVGRGLLNIYEYNSRL